MIEIINSLKVLNTTLQSRRMESWEIERDLNSIASQALGALFKGEYAQKAEAHLADTIVISPQYEYLVRTWDPLVTDPYENITTTMDGVTLSFERKLEAPHNDFEVLMALALACLVVNAVIEFQRSSIN